MYRFYKQISANKNVVFLVAGEGVPDEVVNHEEVTLLYKDKKLIGANFFGKEVTLLKNYGMNVALTKETLDGFNSVFIKHGIETLPELKDSGFHVGEIIDIEEHPLDEKKSLIKIKCKEEVYESITSYNLTKGDKVAIATSPCYLSDGTLFTKHIDHNLKVDALVVSGFQIGLSKSESPYKLDHREVGDDIFLD